MTNYKIVKLYYLVYITMSLLDVLLEVDYSTKTSNTGCDQASMTCLACLLKFSIRLLLH